MILVDAQAGDSLFGCDGCGVDVYAAANEIPKIKGWFISSTICLCPACRAAARTDLEELDALQAARKLVAALEEKRQAKGAPT